MRVSVDKCPETPANHDLFSGTIVAVIWLEVVSANHHGKGYFMKQRHSGFTLVEIAIVLVIIGLLLGGILKGQELITNAKVRNLADQQNAIKAAVYAFQDRFRALPGDYSQASVNLPTGTGTPPINGDGNAQITGDERVNAWNHLTLSGLISCSQCSAIPAAGSVPNQNNSPLNAFNGVMEIEYDGNYNNNGAAIGPVRNNLKSGKQIPANILAEVDRKIDDGNPQGGELRFSPWADSAIAPTAAACAPLGATTWLLAGASAPDPNCGAANLF